MIICCSFDTEVVMKTGKEIHKLVYSVLRVDFFLPYAILSDEITVLQILKHLAQVATSLLPKFLTEKGKL